MKKTINTLITAVILTSAAALGSDSVTAVSDTYTPPVTTPPQITNTPLYGPPSVLYKKGDVDRDGTVNIADYCMMLNCAQGGGDYEANDISDLNHDGIVNHLDIRAFQEYLLGRTDSINPIYLEIGLPTPEDNLNGTNDNDEVK